MCQWVLWLYFRMTYIKGVRQMEGKFTTHKIMVHCRVWVSQTWHILALFTPECLADSLAHILPCLWKHGSLALLISLYPYHFSAELFGLMTAVCLRGWFNIISQVCSPELRVEYFRTETCNTSIRQWYKHSPLSGLMNEVIRSMDK